MAWFKVDDKFHAHPKIKMIPRRLRRASLGLWVIAGSWCADYETDGAVPEYMLEEFDADPEEVEALVDVELWERSEDGILFRNWEEFQPTRAQNDHRRGVDAERQRKNRQKQKVTPTTSTKSHGVTGAGVTRDRTVSHADVTETTPEPRPWETGGDLPAATENSTLFPLASEEGHGVTPGGVTDPSRSPRTRPDPAPTNNPPTPAGVKAFVYPDSFERTWKAWPKSGDNKRSAFTAWERATRGTSRKPPRITAEELHAAVEQYAADGNLPPNQYIPAASKWINQDYWENGPLPPRGGPSSGRPDPLRQGLETTARLRAAREAREQTPQYPQLTSRRTA